MNFALQNAGLISYVNSIAVKPILYTKSEFVTVSKQKIKKREADIEK